MLRRANLMTSRRRALKGVALAVFQPQSFFTLAQTPGVVSANDNLPYNLGIRFTSTTNGNVLGVRFYKGPTNTGVHTGHLWNAQGGVVASVTFQNETASGWQTASFASPVAISKNTDYIIGYHTASGMYSTTTNYFTDVVTSGPLSTSGLNGLFNNTTDTGVPNSSFNATNYWVDVIFQATEAEPTPPPPPTVPADANTETFEAATAAAGAFAALPTFGGFTFTNAEVYNRQSGDGLGYRAKSGTKLVVSRGASLLGLKLRRTDNSRFALYGAWFSAADTSGLMVYATALRGGVAQGSVAFSTVTGQAGYANFTAYPAFDDCDEIQFKANGFFGFDDLSWVPRTTPLTLTRPPTGADSGLLAPAVLQPSGGSDIVGFNLTNPTGSASSAETVRFNQQFAATDLPSGQFLTATVGGASRTLQMDVEQRHADGSVKSALITLAQPSLAAGASVQGILQRTATAQAASLPLNQAIVNGYDLVLMMVIGGTTYTVDAAAELTSAISGVTYQQYRRGPLAVELRVNKLIVNAFRVSLVITANADGSTSTQIQFNNDLADEVTGGALNFTSISVTQGGQTKWTYAVTFTQGQYQKWFKLITHGAGATGALLVVHDIPYRQQIGVFQPVDLKKTLPTVLATNQNAILNDATLTRDHLPVGGLYQFMPSVGGRPDIGVHTLHEAAWMIEQNKRTFDMMALWARASGSPPMHMFRRVTGQYVNTDQKPTIWVDPADRGTNRPDTLTQSGYNAIYAASGWTPESAHVPEASYVHYMVTGDHFSLDTLVGFASWSMCSCWWEPRQNGLCIFANGEEQSRAQAWMMRQVLNAVEASPDSSPEKEHYSRVASRNFANHVANIPSWSVTDGDMAGYLHAVTGDGTQLGQVSMDFWASQTTRATRNGDRQALTLLRHNSQFNINRFGYVVGNNDLDPRTGFMYLFKYRQNTGSPPYATWAAAQIGNWGGAYTRGRAKPAGYTPDEQFFAILTAMGACVSFTALARSATPSDHLLACDFARIRGWLEWHETPGMYGGNVPEPQHWVAIRMPDGTQISTTEMVPYSAAGSGNSYTAATPNVLIYDYGAGGNTLTAGSKGSILIDHSENGGDTLVGGAGSDYLIGTSGGCTFRPGGGANVVRCSDGLSTIEANPATTSSVEIHGFKLASDRIDIVGTTPTAATTLASAVVAGGNTTLTVGSTSVVLVGVTSGLTTGNFI